VRAAMKKRKPFPATPPFVRNQGFYGTLFREVKDGADAMKWKILAAVMSLALLSAPAFAQSAPPKEPLQTAGKADGIPKEIRMKIRHSLGEQAPERIPAANFPIRLGEKVPESVKHHQLPVDIVEMAPQLRGYDYVWIGDEVIFLNPGTREIVAILAV
jgi:hypothetical protein